MTFVLVLKNGREIGLEIDVSTAREALNYLIWDNEGSVRNNRRTYLPFCHIDGVSIATSFIAYLTEAEV